MDRDIIDYDYCGALYIYIQSVSGTFSDMLVISN